MTSASYRADVDGLRAVAVLGVVGFHAFPNYVRGGFVGVDVFFVISGFLITRLLLPDAQGRVVGLAEFYARRIRRIFPALAIVLAACLACGWYILLPEEFERLAKHAAAGAAFVANLAFWRESGYFDASADSKPLLHLWSLGIEEQFYLVFPLVLIACRGAGARVLAWTLGAGAAVSFALNVGMIHEEPVAAFYAPWSRVWELLAGAVLAVANAASGVSRQAVPDRDPQAAPERWRTAASAAGALAILGAMVGFDRAMAFPGWWALLPVLGTVLVIAGHPGAAVNRWLGHRWLVAVGLVSYPLYLWHWPLLRLDLIASGELLGAARRVGLIVAAFVLAWLTYELVERPIRRRAARRVPVQLATAMALVATVSTVIALGAISPRNGVAGLEHIVSAVTDWQFPPPSFEQRFFEGNRFFEQRSAHPATVLFVGDSNVEQFAPRVADLLTRRPWAYKSVVFATKGGCLPIPDWNPPGISCEKRLRAAEAFATRPEVDTVVLGGSWINLQDAGQPTSTVAPALELIRRLRHAGKAVYVILNIPAGRAFDPRSMFAGSRLTHMTAAKQPPPFERDAFLAHYGPLRDELRRIAKEGGAAVVDPMEVLCPGARCPTVSEDGSPLYLDEHHMRPFYARRSATFIDALIAFDRPVAFEGAR